MSHMMLWYSPGVEEGTAHGKILVGEKLASLVNCELFTKIFPTNIQIFLANSFYLYSSPKLSPAKYFPCTVGNSGG